MLSVFVLLNCKIIKPDKPDYYFMISTGLHNAYVESVDKSVTRSIEDALKNLEMKSTFSCTTEDLSTVILQFPGNIMPDTMTKVIQNKINDISVRFPNGTDKPVITEYSSNEMPAAFVGIDSQYLSRYDLYQICNNELQKGFSEIKGITCIVTGNETPKIKIIISIPLLNEYNISFSDVVKSLKESYNNSKVKTGYSIIYEISASEDIRGSVEKFNGIYNSGNELAGFTIVKNSDNEIIRLRDVAEIKFDGELSCYSRVNGKTYPGIMIKMQNVQNIPEIKSRLHEVITDFEKEMPASVKLIFFN
jgi:multidrug efflux pump subunit AcrB